MTSSVQRPLIADICGWLVGHYFESGVLVFSDAVAVDSLDLSG